MTEHYQPDDLRYWESLAKGIMPKPEINIRDYMISEAGLKKILEDGGRILVRKDDGTMVIEEGEQD